MSVGTRSDAQTPALGPPPAAPEPAPLSVESIWRLSVDQYHAMARAGILGEDDPVELLEGWLVRKMTKNPPHVLATGLLLDALAPLIPAGWHLRKEDPVAAADSVPEPDLALVRGGRRDYQGRHPGPADVALVVEVAESTLALDQTLKRRIYARSGFACYWVVNLPSRTVEVHTDPTGPGERPDYRARRDYGESESVPVIIEGREAGQVAVRAILP